jgi:hypothetical protein
LLKATLAPQPLEPGTKEELVLRHGEKLSTFYNRHKSKLGILALLTGNLSASLRSNGLLFANKQG